jgi:hypothetical protein
MLSQVNTAGINLNKLKQIQKNLNNSGYNPFSASTNNVTKYNSLVNRIAAVQALRNANKLTTNSSNQEINNALNNLRRHRNKLPSNMKIPFTTTIEQLERKSLFKKPTKQNNFLESHTTNIKSLANFIWNRSSRQGLFRRINPRTIASDVNNKYRNRGGITKNALINALPTNYREGRNTARKQKVNEAINILFP